MSVQMIDVPKDQDPSRTWLGSTRTTRTQAHPKQSLFGTTLQQRESNIVDDLRKLTVNIEDARNPPRTSGRGKSVKGRSPQTDAIFGEGENILEHTHEQLAQRQRQISRAENMLHAVEEKARYFNVGTNTDIREIPNERSKQSQKITESDLQHASDMNNVGLNNNGSYNHQKYGKKNPVHKYQIVGDPLGKGMEFSIIAEKPNHMVPPMAPFKRHKDPYAVPREAYMKHKSEPVLTQGGVAIPANIRHQFGSAVCEQLFSDVDTVQRCMSDQDQERIRKKRPHRKTEKIELPPQALDPSYDEIGTSTRANIFGPSITRNHKIGTMKEDFNDRIHARRVAETDEYKYIRDELSTWAEQNVLRERVKKAWDGVEPKK